MKASLDHQDFLYDGVLYFEYDPEENVFYDQCGLRMASILEAITPNQLYMFRHDPMNCWFPCRNDSRIACMLIDPTAGRMCLRSLMENTTITQRILKYLGIKESQVAIEQWYTDNSVSFYLVDGSIVSASREQITSLVKGEFENGTNT